MTIEKPEPATRMRAEDRRELVLAAAAAVFAERGYVGATTDAVARAAGVSQPYIVRMFGSKAALFAAVLQRSLDRLLACFRAAIAAADGDDEQIHLNVSTEYLGLLEDRGILLSLMQAFMLGADPEIGPLARAGWLQVYRVLRDEAHLSGERITEVLSYGMLINTLVGVQMASDWKNPDTREMLETLMPTKASLLRDLLREKRGAGTAAVAGTAGRPA